MKHSDTKDSVPIKISLKLIEKSYNTQNDRFVATHLVLTGAGVEAEQVHPRLSVHQLDAADSQLDSRACKKYFIIF